MHISNMFGRFFDASEVDNFASLIVVEVKKLLSPATAINCPELTAKHRDQFIASVRRRATSLVNATKLNFFQKAKLGVLLGEKLEAAGYPPAFSKQLSTEVVEIVAFAATQKR